TVTDSGGRSASDTRSITISGRPVVAIGAPADGTRVQLGDPVTLSATATDPEDGTLTPALRWTSSRDGNLGTGGSLTVSTLTAGTHVLTASATDSDLLTGQRQVTLFVNAPPTVQITAPTTGSVFERDTPITFGATATDAEDGAISTAVLWTSSLDGALGSGASITTRTLHSGTHTITATVTDSGGKQV